MNKYYRIFDELNIPIGKLDANYTPDSYAEKLIAKRQKPFSTTCSNYTEINNKKKENKI